MDEQSINYVASIGSTRGVHTDALISRIENILENIVDALSENRALTIPLRNRQSGNEALIRFPANTEAEVKKFTCLLQILHMCHEALISGHIITKRNIYYQNPDLFGSQQYVDKLVDDIAFTFGVGRDALSVVAAYKGLIAGRTVITLKTNSILDCSSDENGTLIPQFDAIHKFDIGEAKWVLVIEKEATFRGLAASKYFETSTAGAGILVTGKGYPDLVTRQFLHRVHSSFPEVPIFALVDFDPSGIDIMLTYKRGSRSLGHEENVTVPGLSWLGPKSCDVLDYAYYRNPIDSPSQPNISTPPSSQESSSSSHSSHTLSADALDVSSHLTYLDRRKVVNLLARLDSDGGQNTDEECLMHELQLMLILNLKAEIQAVDDAGDMTRWLDERLTEQLAISEVN
ncbi:DNA topoisomerase IV, alpha subunit [Hypoxylon trugodes]|uniref:DNA topoisomerase IV, alpha subunit n=1 Tax=Hypoxylon trugodes TaxID=326681 RepID=UPI00218FED8F|nr:DNA topoisomerase IV, alpha subunit [Hypoxylon trugodes]KAI1391641.1 DNA topoisomerase IV, alpha subunit [Hypoxylon trugodes]